MAYFLYLLLVDGIIFTYIMATYARTSAILYIYLLFMTYSVHWEVFGGLHSKDTSLFLTFLYKYQLFMA